MTAFGIYFVIVQFLGILATFYYAGQGGVRHDRGTLVVSGLWAVFNLIGLLVWGTGTGV